MTDIPLIMVNETRKGLLLMWNYRFNALSELLVTAFTFIGAGFFVNNGELDPVKLAPMLLGYLIWFYANVASSNMSYNLTEEARSGTLEQMYMSPAPMGLIMIGRILSMLLTATLQLGLVAISLILLLHLNIPLRWQGLVVFGLTFAGLIGFSLMIGGLTLVYKSTAAFVSLTQNLLLLMNGALLPVSRFPRWLEIIALMLPTTQGIVVLRRVLIDGQSLTSAWNDGSLVFLIIHSAVYFFGGLLIFRYCERVAKRQGTLGQY
jgi:ABC-2 type transport system permease protein